MGCAGSKEAEYAASKEEDEDTDTPPDFGVDDFYEVSRAFRCIRDDGMCFARISRTGDEIEGRVHVQGVGSRQHARTWS